MYGLDVPCLILHFIYWYTICDLADNNMLSLTPQVIDFPFPLVCIILHQYHVTHTNCTVLMA